jgi:hypothetical protein
VDGDGYCDCTLTLTQCDELEEAGLIYDNCPNGATEATCSDPTIFTMAECMAAQDANTADGAEMIIWTYAGTGPDNQINTDGDRLGDACEGCINDANNDSDHDGVCYCTLEDCSGVTHIIDNCDQLPNGDHEDTDGDGVGQEDIDGDGVGDVCDNCPSLANLVSDCDENVATENVQCDSDYDGIGDVCDNCPYIANVAFHSL